MTAAARVRLDGGMVVALLGFVSGVVYGASDFFGGIASRRMPALIVSAIGTLISAIVAAVWVVIAGGHWSTAAVVLGIVGGIGGSLGTWAFYSCLAIGPMSVLSPGVAAIYALLPAVVGIALGERLAPIGYLALVAVIGAAVLLAGSRTADATTRISRRAIVLGVIAGVGYAGYIIAMGRTPTDSGPVPLLVDQVAACALYGVALLVWVARRRAASRGSDGSGAVAEPSWSRRGLGQSVVAGVLLAAANVLLIIGLHLGDLAVMGVLNALYPLGTVLLALIILGERLTRWQVAGIVLALAASATLAVV